MKNKPAGGVSKAGARKHPKRGVVNPHNTDSTGLIVVHGRVSHPIWDKCKTCDEIKREFIEDSRVHEAFGISAGLSNCCKAKVSVVGSDEGTYYYECVKCKKPCDSIGGKNGV